MSRSHTKFRAFIWGMALKVFMKVNAGVTNERTGVTNERTGKSKQKDLTQHGMHQCTSWKQTEGVGESLKSL
jgi:hypothetical protein